MSFITRAVRKTLDNDPACDRNDGIEFELLLGELSKIKVTR